MHGIQFNKLPNPLPLLKLGPGDNVVFKTYVGSNKLLSLTTEKPEDLRYFVHGTKKGNVHRVQLHFSSGNVEHQGTCSDEQQGWLNAYIGAYALSFEGVESPKTEPWILNVEIEDLIGSSAWILQHISSKNFILRTIAQKAHRYLLTLEDSCIESKKKSKRSSLN